MFTGRLPRRTIIPLAGTAPGQGTVAFALNNRGIIVGIYVDSHGTTLGFELNNAR